MSYILKNIKLSPFQGLTESKVTSDFGPRTFYNSVTKKTESDFHSGIDMTSGETIVAVADGVVTSSRNNIEGYNEEKASGNYVTINHGDKIYTTYCHMVEGSVQVKAGDKVVAGTILGTKGSTGHSTGEHLHFGVRVNGTWVDPKPYLLGEKDIGSYKANPEPQPTPSPEPIPEPYESDFEEGDIVEPINPVNVEGTPLKQYDKYYTITDLSENKDKATLSARGQVWATLYTKDIRKVEEPEKETFEEGDKVVPTRLVNYNGTPLIKYDKYYIISDYKPEENPDKVVLSARGEIWATMNIKDIAHYKEV